MAMQIFQQGARIGHPMPDATMALVLGVAASLDFLTPEQLAKIPASFVAVREELAFVLFVEGGFLMASATLIDIATRLQKQPPWWLAVLIVGGVLLISGTPITILQAAWQSGTLVFLPLILSVGERVVTLWRMPLRSRLEKIAARALVANRLTTGLAIAALITAVTLTGVADAWRPGDWPFLLGGAIYFAIAAFDDWRVRGPAFARRQRVLFGYDAIGIDYLAPV